MVIWRWPHTAEGCYSGDNVGSMNSYAAAAAHSPLLHTRARELNANFDGLGQVKIPEQ